MRGSILCFALIMVLNSVVIGQPHKIKIMTLGVFHFAYPNLDVQKVDKKDQINVLDEQRQKEIISLVNALKTFHPTKIVIERRASQQRRIDSLYQMFTKNKYQLAKGEDEQIGFRLANELQLPQLYCVDDWGKLYDHLNFLMDDSLPRTKAFDYFYFHNPDTIYDSISKRRLRTPSTISEILAEINNRERIKSDLGGYLVGHFKYEETAGDYLGADFEAGRWFDRNLRIFRNIQRVPATSDDRILVIYGAGHLNILNYLLECSPEYELVDPAPYLTGK